MRDLNPTDSIYSKTSSQSRKDEKPELGDSASRRLARTTRTDVPKPAVVHDDTGHVEFESHSKVSHLVSAFDFGGSDEHSSKASQAERELNPGPDGWKSVKQGGFGDCYFLSAMVDVAKQNPKTIRDLIKQNDNGSYTVSFHGREPITVDGKGLPDGVQADGKWAQVLEQAWETQLGNVRNGKVDEWGSSGSADALEALTGQKFGERSANLLQTGLSQELTDDIVKALREGKPVTAATGGISSLWEGPKDNTVGKHVYSVIGVDDKGNIQVRNPWGTDKDGNGDGTQWMSQEQFKRDFKTVTLPGDSDLEGAIGRELFHIGLGAKHLAQDFQEDVAPLVEETKKVIDKGVNVAKDVVKGGEKIIEGGIGLAKDLWDSVL